MSSHVNVRSRIPLTLSFHLFHSLVGDDVCIDTNMDSVLKHNIFKITLQKCPKMVLGQWIPDIPACLHCSHGSLLRRKYYFWVCFWCNPSGCLGHDIHLFVRSWRFPLEKKIKCPCEWMTSLCPPLKLETQHTWSYPSALSAKGLKKQKKAAAVASAPCCSIIKRSLLTRVVCMLVSVPKTPN